MSLCEENCDFSEYDIQSNKAICSCFVKMKLPLISEIKFDKKKLLSNFKDIRNIGNFKMLKCIDLLIDKNNMFKNSANYLMATLTALSISSIFVFIFYDRIKIKNYINLISAEKNLNNNSNNKNLNKKIENNKINKKKKGRKK